MTNTLQNTGASTSSEAIERTLRETLAAVRADAVFGRTVERGGTTVIPCAEVFVGIGLGGGRGTNPSSQSQSHSQQTGEGEGYGGGGGGRGRPIAAIVVGADGVRVEPVLDVTRIALAGMTTGAFITFWLARLALDVRGVRGGRGGPAKAPSPARLARALRS